MMASCCCSALLRLLSLGQSCTQRAACLACLGLAGGLPFQAPGSEGPGNPLWCSTRKHRCCRACMLRLAAGTHPARPHSAVPESCPAVPARQDAIEEHRIATLSCRLMWSHTSKLPTIYVNGAGGLPLNLIGSFQGLRHSSRRLRRGVSECRWWLAERREVQFLIEWSRRPGRHL